MDYTTGSANKHLSELEKISRGLYPRYDSDTLTRKIRKVVGYVVKGEMRLDDLQWRMVMDECAREYRLRGIRLVSSAAMSRMEYNGASLAAQRLQRRDFDRLRASFVERGWTGVLERLGLDGAR